MPRQLKRGMDASAVKTAVASAIIGEYCSRLCTLEGFLEHAE